MKKLLLIAALLFATGISKADVIVTTVTGNGFHHILDPFTSDSIEVPESIGTLKIGLLRRSGDNPATVFVIENIADTPRARGPLFENEVDFTYTPGASWIAFQTGEKFIDLNIVDDGRFEVDENISLIFDGAIGAANGFGSRYTLNIKILNDDVEGDVNGDGRVGFKDFLIMGANWGTFGALYTDGDLNGDFEVNFPDFLILSENFGDSKLPI